MIAVITEGAAVLAVKMKVRTVPLVSEAERLREYSPEPISDTPFVVLPGVPPSLETRAVTERPVCKAPVVLLYIGKENPFKPTSRLMVSCPVDMETGLVTVAMVPPITVAVTVPVIVAATVFVAKTMGMPALEVTAVPNQSTTFTLVVKVGTVAVMVPRFVVTGTPAALVTAVPNHSVTFAVTMVAAGIVAVMVPRLVVTGTPAELVTAVPSHWVTLAETSEGTVAVTVPTTVAATVFVA